MTHGTAGTFSVCWPHLCTSSRSQTHKYHRFGLKGSLWATARGDESCCQTSLSSTVLYITIFRVNTFFSALPARPLTSLQRSGAADWPVGGWVAQRDVGVGGRGTAERWRRGAGQRKRERRNKAEVDSETRAERERGRGGW